MLEHVRLPANNVPEMLHRHGGDHRKAEVECWSLWDKAGHPHPDSTGLVQMAIAIADDYHFGSVEARERKAHEREQNIRHARPVDVKKAMTPESN